LARSASSIPAVLSYLSSHLDQLLESLSVLVTDGPPKPPQDLAPDILCLGYTGIDGDMAVEDTRSRAQLTSTPDRESYTITSIVSSWHGHETNMQDVRETVFEIINTITEDFGRDQTLGGLVMRARLQTDSLMQVQTDQGAVATARIIIGIDAYTG
jgi:hypothetical protein